MLKRRGKGKVSNDLVAASCMAVLAVYAAGYSRTRDAARRFETQAKERRAATGARRTAAKLTPPVISAPAPQPAPEYNAAPETATARAAAPRPSVPAVAPKPANKKAVVSMPVATATATATTAAPSPLPSGVQEIAPVPMPAQESTASTPIAITREPAATSTAKWRDGTYTGLGDSPHGDIEARVVIRDGRIVEAGIASCDTRYPCSVIDPLIHQPVDRQSADVDYMSHATESSDAYYYALVAALDSAREQSPADATIPK
ncbi:MAG TPA: hypothetical protein VGV09_12215 [Steroidobacteraceae bacterium]|nr:hypothetical protein [Steroidobacteraceae bacterium]